MVWTIASGPHAFDPLTANQPVFDQARLRISNAPGHEGELQVLTLSSDTDNSPQEVYTVQAQLGSNTATLKVTVTPFPLSRLDAQLRRPPVYVSHFLIQSNFVAPRAALPVRLKSLGRFTARAVPSAKLADGNYAASRPAPDHSVDITTNGTWSIVDDSPNVTKIASIAAKANPITREAELVIRRNDPANPVPAAGLVVTVRHSYRGAGGEGGTADAKVLVKP